MTAPDGLPFDGLPFDALDPRSGGAGCRLDAEFPAASVAAPPRPVLHTIPCDEALRRAALALAGKRNCDLGTLAAAALLLTPETLDDPGEGAAVIVLHLPLGPSPSAIRRALAGAVALADPSWRLTPRTEVERLGAAAESLAHRNKALAQALERLSFQPLDGKLTEVRDAAQLFGFVNEWCFDEDRVVRRFRELAPVYHPDTGIVACRERMAQLIEARNLLIRHVRTAYSSGAWVGRRPSAPAS